MIEVSWGNHHPCYDKTKSDYNSLRNQWNRYSENLKRGWVLFSSCVYGYNNFQLTKELMELENLRLKGFESLRKKPKRNVKKDVVETLGDLYNHFGENGDDYSPSNNPWNLHQIKKDNEELSVEELIEENQLVIEKIEEVKSWESTKEHLKMLEWLDEQVKFNNEIINLKSK